MQKSHAIPIVAALLAAAALVALPWQDWTNTGGGPARNGLADVAGPVEVDLRWKVAPWPAVESSPPFTLGDRVFVVRQHGPANAHATGDALYALDLGSGATLWSVTLPTGGEHKREAPAWIAGASHGRVIASRSARGTPQPLRAYDAATGAPLWTSTVATQTSRDDGALFTPDGDVIVADETLIQRFRGSNGGRVWSVQRSYGHSRVCGGAASATGLFFEREVDQGGRSKLSKLDAATGGVLYESAPYLGGTDDAGNAVSRDGRWIYVTARAATPHESWLLCFEDTGSTLLERWRRPVKAAPLCERGVAADGSVFALTPRDELARLSPSDGSVVAHTPPLPNLSAAGVAPSIALDASGSVYLSNGAIHPGSGYGRVWAFDAALSRNEFTLKLERPGPSPLALAGDGTLLVADVRGVFAYRGDAPPPVAYCTVGTTSSGCHPTIGWSGTPSASAGTGFVITVSEVEGDRAGLFFYGITGRAETPWDVVRGQYMCVNWPRQRTPLQHSGGESGRCDGGLALDWDAFVAGRPGALGQPFAPLTRVNAQGWFRDPASSKTTALSNAIEFTIAP